MKPRFSVTYEIVTPESAEHGDVDERGFIATCARLKDAVNDVNGTRTNRVDGVESIEDAGRWITITNGLEFETGAQESRSIRPLFNITPASYKRLCRVLRAR